MAAVIPDSCARTEAATHSDPSARPGKSRELCHAIGLLHADDASGPLKWAASAADRVISMDSSAPRTPPIGQFIERAPLDLTSWLTCFDPTQLPVLRSTALAMEEFRSNEDVVDAHLLAESLSDDPLMILKLLAHVADVRRGREGTGAETVTEALVMLGITPFFRTFGHQPVVEDLLAGNEVARVGFERVLMRARRAGRFALAFALQRMDHDVSVIHEAALLHDFVELLMWVKAPGLSAEIASRQRIDPALRSSMAQSAVLNIGLDELQHALMQRWKLPELLIAVADARLERVSVQARNVLLAVRLARHTDRGWESPALANDLQDIAALLNMAPEPTLALLRDLDSA